MRNLPVYRNWAQNAQMKPPTEKEDEKNWQKSEVERCHLNKMCTYVSADENVNENSSSYEVLN